MICHTVSCLIFSLLLIALALWMYDHAFIMKNYSCILKGRWHTWLRLTQLKYLIKLSPYQSWQSTPLPDHAGSIPGSTAAKSRRNSPSESRVFKMAAFRISLISCQLPRCTLIYYIYNLTVWSSWYTMQFFLQLATQFYCQETSIWLAYFAMHPHALYQFTLSNTRGFYLCMGEPCIS